MTLRLLRFNEHFFFSFSSISLFYNGKWMSILIFDTIDEFWIWIDKRWWFCWWGLMWCDGWDGMAFYVRVIAFFYWYQYFKFEFYLNSLRCWCYANHGNFDILLANMSILDYVVIKIILLHERNFIYICTVLLDFLIMINFMHLNNMVKSWLVNY